MHCLLYFCALFDLKWNWKVIFEPKYKNQSNNKVLIKDNEFLKILWPVWFLINAKTHSDYWRKMFIVFKKKERRRTKYFALPLITEPLNVLVLICFGLLGHSNNFVCMNSNDNKKSIFQQIWTKFWYKSVSSPIHNRLKFQPIWCTGSWDIT